MAISLFDELRNNDTVRSNKRLPDPTIYAMGWARDHTAEFTRAINDANWTDEQRQLHDTQMPVYHAFISNRCFPATSITYQNAMSGATPRQGDVPVKAVVPEAVLLLCDARLMPDEVATAWERHYSMKILRLENENNKALITERKRNDVVMTSALWPPCSEERLRYRPTALR